MPGHPLFRLLLLVFAVAWLSPGTAVAQQSGVTLQFEEEHIGLGGYVRRGSWTPVRLELYNESAEPRDVVCRWILLDDDKDRVVAERKATLGPQRDERVWLYANPPLDSTPVDRWMFQVVDAQSNRLLVRQEVQVPPTFLEPSVNMVGVCGFAPMGLQPYDRWSTQHEPLKRVDGLSLETLPDRWYGLSSLSSLVWSPEEGGNPDSIKVTEPMRAALREWVYRGGHLVVVLPAAGQTWSSSGLKDLFEPMGTVDMRQIEAVPPATVFGVLKKSTQTAPMLAFDLEDAEGYTAIATVTIGDTPETRVHEPIIVGHRFGFGQITLVGVDLTSTPVLEVVNGFDMHHVWTRIFGWRASTTGQLIPPQVLDTQEGKQVYRDPSGFAVHHPKLGDWVGQRVARQTSASGTLGLALVLFLLYGAVTLLTFPTVLRSKGWDRHSWLVFVGIIAVFSAIAWGGAALLRPAKTSATHFSVLTIDGNRNLVHTRSWVSLFVPRFDEVEVAVPSEPDGVLTQELHNTVASPGMSLSSEDPGYPDTQTYAFDAGQPDRVAFPIRATTKPFVADFLGQITGTRDGLSKPWTLPTAQVKVGANGLPNGTVTHRFDRELTDVYIIYCPGGSGLASDDSWKPWVWEYRNASGGKVWAPNQPLALPNNTQNAERLWLKPRAGTRDFKNEGYLGIAMNAQGGRDGASTDGDIVRDVALLSFFDALPPPKYQRQGGGVGIGFDNDFWTYSRPLLREIDLTELTTGRRLIVIGHLRGGEAPLPISVDGEVVPTEGWTVVRWIYDL